MAFEGPTPDARTHRGAVSRRRQESERPGLYRADEFAEFTVEEFRRGLEGLTEEEALFRPEKADGTQMNAISWTVQHVAGHWLNVALAVRELPLESRRPPGDGTPPPYAGALALFDEATSGLDWVAAATDQAMSRPWTRPGGESVAMFLARAVQHTWFHIGEINAVSQLLGHPEIVFVGDLAGRLDWVPAERDSES